MSQAERGKHRRPHAARYLIDSYRRPEPAQPGDGNAWHTGICWFWCDFTVEQQVIYVGDIEVPGRLRGRLTACGLCVETLFEKTWRHSTYQDCKDVVGRRGNT
ncbi:hypothetical protein [Streptomyces mirabilis]|uniref:hypothetical protein n=1 Tax=Streptomyces mirabilis TaxID=68239 RepID=UPI0036B7FC0F